jgi:hypothetical protein
MWCSFINFCHLVLGDRGPIPEVIVGFDRDAVEGSLVSISEIVNSQLNREVLRAFSNPPDPSEPSYPLTLERLREFREALNREHRPRQVAPDEVAEAAVERVAPVAEDANLPRKERFEAWRKRTAVLIEEMQAQGA